MAIACTSKGYRSAFFFILRLRCDSNNHVCSVGLFKPCSSTASMHSLCGRLEVYALGNSLMSTSWKLYIHANSKAIVIS